MTEAAGWWQVVYGKLVESEHGPILRQSEHHQSAVSVDIPDRIATLCYPERVGIGTDDLLHGWGRYRWPDGPGGFVYTPKVVGDRYYVLAARVRGRFEIPQLKDRLYTQAYYLANDPDAAATWPLLDWWGCLVARPSLRNETIGRRSLATRDAPVPANALAMIGPMLSRILAGHAFVATEEEVQPEAFYLQIRLALACLPAALRWRIPVGAGLFVIDRDRMAIAQGMETKDAAAQPAAPLLDEDAIQEYIAGVAAILKSSSTLSQVMQAVDRWIPELSAWQVLSGSTPPSPDWRDAVARFAEYWQEVRLLCRWLTSVSNSNRAGQRISIRAMRDLRERAVRSLSSLLAKSADGATTGALDDMVDWQEAWKQVANDGEADGRNSAQLTIARGLAGLLGAVAIEPEPLAAVGHIELPDSWQSKSTPALRAALRKGLLGDAASGPWRQMALDIFATATLTNWLAEFSTHESLEQDRLLYWLLLYRRQPNDVASLDGWQTSREL
ncbi:MAG TPA: hypothetical protein VGG64_08930, partial [Pirellulales bacterium]